MSADISGWVDRLNAVEARLQAMAVPRRGFTAADPDTGERWEAGQVWGHLAEFIQYWTAQVGDVIDAFQGEPVPFGRARDDPGRAAGIALGTRTPLPTLWEEVRSDLADLRNLLRALPDGWEKAVGLHPRLGQVPTPRIFEDFLVSHLEEHAAQLEQLSGDG
jgi:hypothetical protein